MTLRPVSNHRGFSLIEVLVGVAIGIVGILVMFRMVALWETSTRSAMSGSDAQAAGTLAMFTLERDIRQAGHGFGTADPPFMGCAVAGTNTSTGTPINFNFYPLEITPGVGGAPDRIRTLYGDSSFYVDQQSFVSSTATTKTLSRRGGFHRGDVAIVAGNQSALPASATCALIEVTDDTNPDKATIAHTNGAYTSFYVAGTPNSRFNPAGGTGGTFSSGSIYSLGPQPILNQWVVGADGTLTRSEIFQGSPAFDAAERVVNLKAQYGIDTTGDRVVDTWTTVPPADWTTVLAMRVAILVRSKQFEKLLDPNTNLPVAVTPTLQNPTWAGGNFVMTNVDGTADSFTDAQPDPNNWRYYRYRVYERVVPLRNMIWGTAP